jgi:hypothetical protein
MPTGARRLAEDNRPAGAEAPRAGEPESPLVALQRTAGNAAMAQLARQWAFNPVAPPAPKKLNMRDPLEVGDLMADETAAGRAAFAYFDAQNKGGVISISVAELVHCAGQQTFKRKDGGEGKVIDILPADKLEEQLRGRAKHFGVTVMEHRAATDLPGMKSEMDAILANLGAIPTEVTLGGEDLKITASIFGTIKGEARIGPAKVEGEASSEGVEGSVKVPGATLKGSVGEKGIKASLKLGDLVTIDGGLKPKDDGSVDWRAEISVGTIGKLIMPEDVAKVFVKAQDTFSKSAGELVRHRDDPMKVKEHGSELAEALSEAVEKAKKSAEQSKKTGWRFGAELKGDGAGGISGGFTLTWTFP